MIPNRSPWIHQLNRTRPTIPLTEDVHTDIVIVGGGIAGVTTAFFTLRNTEKKVILLEAEKVAHGATGHNAGQITSYFERPLSDLVREFGAEMAVDGQRSIESAWMLIDEIMAETQLRVPLYRFTGYAGLSSLEQVLLHLGNNRHRADNGLAPESIMIADTWSERSQIPAVFDDLYTLAPHEDILELLETKNTDYIASLAYQKGCMNSALFSEELIRYLAATYPDRFSFYEKSPVTEVSLYETHARLHVLDHTVTTDRVVLCTNGFEHFTITNESGPDIDTTFHHMVNGRIGYMSGYLQPHDQSPIAISYFPKVEQHAEGPTGETYFYLTRRPYEYESGKPQNLVSTGGPERILSEGEDYIREGYCSEEIRNSIEAFLHTSYEKHPEEEVEYAFCWHGLMGYTPNGIRRVGIEPCNPVLLYNLGCNGVGILPSIFGSMRISRILKGESLAPSIFDPHDQRCAL